MDKRYEHCCHCDALTGRAGKADDSLYLDNGDGPYCEGCWNVLRIAELEAENLIMRVDAELISAETMRQLKRAEKAEAENAILRGQAPPGVQSRLKLAQENVKLRAALERVKELPEKWRDHEKHIFGLTNWAACANDLAAIIKESMS